MESVRLLKLSLKYMKPGNKKQSKKLQKNNSTSDPQLDPIAMPHGMYSPSDPSTPTSSSIIPLLSPVYIMVPPQFPDTEERSPAMGSSDRSPKRERTRDKMRTLSSKRQPSPTKLADPTTVIMVFQPPCVL